MTTELASPAHRADAVARILAAAETLFAEHGYDRVSMNQIAAAASVSKANVFHHFSSKKELYLAVVRGACSAAERLQTLGEPGGPVARRLPDYAEGMLRDMLEHQQIHRLILRELLTERADRFGQDLADRVFGDYFARLVAILRAAQESGELRGSVDPAMVATVLIGANVFFFQSQDVLRHFPDVDFAQDPARYSRMLVDLLLKGMAAADAAPDTRKTRKNVV